MPNLVKIDELTIQDHTYLSLDSDECYYFFNYTSRKGFSYSKENSLISNLKKCPSKKGQAQYQYKLSAIKTISSYFNDIFDDEALKTITFVPIPPSKNKSDDLYDDRMLQILKIGFNGRDADIRELVEQIESKEASHISDVRPTIQEIKSNLKINTELSKNLKDVVFIIDDVLTTGAHFKAVKSLLNSTFPNCRVIGVFICRREIDFTEN
ncbi:hypothetical protein [Flavobacterium sp. IMCC34518]|uniref:hypothetical protein n=1 Tax=Flavobacterium sp. IMCC34518 TaxID=3003623 RepID=UPI0022AC0383|nr:hypothetical protein [Flavobacterium sp. IMCC34518]